MRVHVLQHVAFEGLGCIEPWLEQRGAQVSFSRFFESPPTLPDLADFDLLIVLGGPMSVNDEELFPWLGDEERFIGEALRAGRAVLGICLGAQLIASALGAAIYRGMHKEIGFFPIRAVAAGPETFHFPDSVEVFHWHGETFALPDGAVLLAKSAACAKQAFQFGPRAIALQFHIETTPASVAAMLEHCADELVPAPFIESAEAMLAKPAASYAGINALMGEVLDYLSRPLPARG